jgi:hypothetical protein
MLKKIKIIKGREIGKVIEEREDLLAPFIAAGIGEWYDEPGETKELKEPKTRGRKAKD